MCSPGINGEGELRGQPANPGSPGKMAVKTESGVCVFVYYLFVMMSVCRILVKITYLLIITYLYDPSKSAIWKDLE